jgi:high-affinity K+ transport system ATPase subunit B
MSVSPKFNQANPTHSTFMNSQVRMVTGDNLQTAKAIALECGILASIEEAVEPNIIEGKVFRELSEKEREQVAKKITVGFFLSSIVISFVICISCYYSIKDVYSYIHSLIQSNALLADNFKYITS